MVRHGPSSVNRPSSAFSCKVVSMKRRTLAVCRSISSIERTQSAFWDGKRGIEHNTIGHNSKISKSEMAHAALAPALFDDRPESLPPATLKKSQV